MCAGTYRTSVAVIKPLALEAAGHVVINAAGRDNGVMILASGSPVEGFEVAEAIGEGILAVGTRGAQSSTS